MKKTQKNLVKKSYKLGKFLSLIKGLLDFGDFMIYFFQCGEHFFR